MALRKHMPTRDPGRAAERPQDVREYDPQTGSYSRTPDERPVPGTPNGTQGRLR
ncbi:hypothetical protein ACFW1M_43870 [Streptomyces inhibens]|uniref:hypothetical protein n=1 Tax=Streptomyces inhibens TaxID=2293571 RepID=UPI0036B74615